MARLSHDGRESVWNEAEGSMCAFVCAFALPGGFGVPGQWLAGAGTRENPLNLAPPTGIEPMALPLGGGFP